MFEEIFARIALDIARIPNDMVPTAILLVWNLAVVFVISRQSFILVHKSKSEIQAAYFSRKVIHFLSGGLTALVVPFLSEPFVPFLLAMGLAMMTYIPHKIGRIFKWFQVEDNISEVYFCVVWAFLILLMWYVPAQLGGIWLAVVPILFMSFGDGITGIVRNILYSKRVKSWDGNIAMLMVCIPIGYFTFGWKGILAAILASVVEHYELVDDNISVPLVSWSVLLAFSLFP